MGKASMIDYHPWAKGVNCSVITSIVYVQTRNIDTITITITPL